MNPIIQEAKVVCKSCDKKEALYTCSQCGKPICERCAHAAPWWSFDCPDCTNLSGWYSEKNLRLEGEC